jgi:3-deoxy-D-manno-octulosonate 8-phosphate phosphatase (KDO 8-P phosphatase)
MFLEKLKAIRAIILDVDGVLTDATVIVNEEGEQLRRYNVRDGYAIKLALKKGIRLCAISGGAAKNIRLRLNGLGIDDVFTGVDDKAPVYTDFLARHSLRNEHVLFIGDDMPDLPLMHLAGTTACPEDAVEEIKSASDYISPKKGGEGCVRDVIEKVLKVQGKWHAPSDEKVAST